MKQAPLQWVKATPGVIIAIADEDVCFVLHRQEASYRAAIYQAAVVAGTFRTPLGRSTLDDVKANCEAWYAHYADKVAKNR